MVGKVVAGGLGGLHDSVATVEGCQADQGLGTGVAEKDHMTEVGRGANHMTEIAHLFHSILDIRYKLN